MSSTCICVLLSGDDEAWGRNGGWFTTENGRKICCKLVASKSKLHVVSGKSILEMSKVD